MAARALLSRNSNPTPSDTAPALVALDASFRVVGPEGERVVPAGEAAIAGARPLAKNAYKIPLTKGVARRTILELAS